MFYFYYNYKKYLKEKYVSIITSIKNLKSDVSVSAIVAGLIAVIVSYAGPFVIVFQAAQAANISNELITSWVWAISIGSAITGVYLSLKFKQPIITAWSTPGAAVLVLSLPNYTFNEAIGAFILSSVLILLVGLSGFSQKIMDKIPMCVASAMLAGILFKFGLDVFGSLELKPIIVLPMIIFYFLGKVFFPRYAVTLSLIIGIVMALLYEKLDFSVINLSIAHPIFTMPHWDISALINIGIPLFIVTMASQNIPGIAVLKSAGYKPNTSSLISFTGFISLLLAPFGSHGLNLAAITAAICTGEESHQYKSKRYIAGVACGLFYLLIGIFGSTLIVVFATLPKVLVASIAGLALFPAISNSLSASMENEKFREIALVTFLITVSGISFFGIGSAFWGLIVGALLHTFYMKYNR